MRDSYTVFLEAAALMPDDLKMEDLEGLGVKLDSTGWFVERNGDVFAVYAEIGCPRLFLGRMRSSEIARSMLAGLL